MNRRLLPLILVLPATFAQATDGSLLDVSYDAARVSCLSNASTSDASTLAQQCGGCKAAQPTLFCAGSAFDPISQAPRR